MSEVAPKRIITYIKPVFPVGAKPPRMDLTGVGVAAGPDVGVFVGPGVLVRPGVLVGVGVGVLVRDVVGVGVGTVPQFSIA